LRVAFAERGLGVSRDRSRACSCQRRIRLAQARLRGGGVDLREQRTFSDALVLDEQHTRHRAAGTRGHRDDVRVDLCVVGAFDAATHP
jgi:hypothetical protein